MKQFFTQRRGGAKWGNKSKHRRIVGHAIGDAPNAVLDQVVADEAKNLSALAPLRETSATQSQEESFSPRREGAKRDTSNGRISISNPSALASLRETSATQSQEESFTRGREGAKRTETSNGQISVSNLSALAPLRETFGSETISRQGAKAQRGKTRLKHPGLAWVDHPSRGFILKSSRLSVFARDLQSHG